MINVNAEASMAAEELGRSYPCKETKFVLLALLQHPSPLVREGAVIGLYYNIDDAVQIALKEVESTDASPGVRLAAKEVLDECTP